MLISKEKLETKLEQKLEKVLFHVSTEEVASDLYPMLVKRAYMNVGYEPVLKINIGVTYKIDTINRIVKHYVGKLPNNETVYRGFTDERNMKIFGEYRKLNNTEEKAAKFLSNISSKTKFYCSDSEESMVLFKILRFLGYKWANGELLNNPGCSIMYIIDPEERKVRYTKNGIKDDSVVEFSSFESTSTTDKSDKEDEIHISYDKRLECLFIKTAKDVICVPGVLHVAPQLLEHVSIIKNMDDKTAEELKSLAYYRSLTGGTDENFVFSNTKPGNKIQQKKE